jgi:hypothetical protein
MTTTRGQPGGASRDGPAAVEERLRRRRGADPGCCSGVGAAWRGVGADAACSGAWSRGLEASPNLEFTVRASMFGKVCLRHSLRFRRALARHITSLPRERKRGAKGDWEVSSLVVVSRRWPKAPLKNVPCCYIFEAGKRLPGKSRVSYLFYQNFSARAAPNLPYTGL